MKLDECQKYFPVLAFCLGSAVFMITVTRAATTGITYDEAATYLYYVKADFMAAFFERKLLNNHILNTLMIKIFVFLTDLRYTEFIIRLPNIICYIVYIVFSWFFSKHFKYGFFVFLMLICNYYLNEFFGLARGYGMAAMFVLIALYYFDQWEDKPDHKRAFHLMMICFVLSALANPISLYIVAGALIVCFRIMVKNKTVSVYVESPCTVLYGILLAAIGIFHIIVSRNDRFVFSADSFYTAVLSIPGMFSDMLYVQIGVMVAGIGIIALGMRDNRWNAYAYMAGIYFLMCLAGQVIFHRGYPLERSMIPLYPLLVSAVAKSLDTVRLKQLNAILCIAGLLLVGQFAAKIDVQKTKDWEKDYEIRRAIDTYVMTHNITEDPKAFTDFILTMRQNPAALFYGLKLEEEIRRVAGTRPASGDAHPE